MTFGADQTHYQSGAVDSMTDDFEKMAQMEASCSHSKRTDHQCGADQWLEIFRDKLRSQIELTVTSQTWLEIFREKRRAHLCHVISELNERHRRQKDSDVTREQRKPSTNSNKTAKQQNQLRIIRLFRSHESLVDILEEAAKLQQKSNLKTGWLAEVQPIQRQHRHRRSCVKI